MRKIMVIGLAAIIGLMASGAAYAMGPGACRGAGFTAVTNVNIESVKNFLKDTSKTRDELIIKRIELFKEYKKAEVDYDRIAAIKKDIIDLKTKILDTARKYGLDNALRFWMGMRGSIMEHHGMRPGMMEHGKTGPWMNGKGMGPGMGDCQNCPYNTPE